MSASVGLTPHRAEKFLDLPREGLQPNMDACKPLHRVTLYPVVGDHGDAYPLDKPAPAIRTSVLTCGCQRHYPVAPITGEMLWCSRHQAWVPGRTIGSYVVRCLTCQRRDKDGFDLSGSAHFWAKRHAYGKNGNLNPPHIVRVGRYTFDGIEWLAVKGG